MGSPVYCEEVNICPSAARLYLFCVIKENEIDKWPRFTMEVPLQPNLDSDGSLAYNTMLGVRHLKQYVLSQTVQLLKLKFELCERFGLDKHDDKLMRIKCIAKAFVSIEFQSFQPNTEELIDFLVGYFTE